MHTVKLFYSILFKKLLWNIFCIRREPCVRLLGDLSGKRTGHDRRRRSAVPSAAAESPPWPRRRWRPRGWPPRSRPIEPMLLCYRSVVWPELLNKNSYFGDEVNHVFEHKFCSQKWLKMLPDLQIFWSHSRRITKTKSKGRPQAHINRNENTKKESGKKESTFCSCFSYFELVVLSETSLFIVVCVRCHLLFWSKIHHCGKSYLHSF